MGDVLDEAQALVQCKTCPWYKSCVLPIRITEEDLKKQLESSMPGTVMPGADQYGMPQFLASLASAAQNALLEGCPIFIQRLRASPRLAQRIKQMMQEWAQDEENKDESP